jgi:hypothetical protein
MLRVFENKGTRKTLGRKKQKVDEGDYIIMSYTFALLSNKFKVIISNSMGLAGNVTRTRQVKKNKHY